MQANPGELALRRVPPVSERIVGVALLVLLGSAVLAALLVPGWVLAVVPGCWFHKFTGLNCPFCGMTRDFIAILHGRWNLLNPCSVPCFFLLFVAYPIVNVLTLLGRIRQPRIAISEKAVFVALAAMFVVNNFSRLGG